MNDKSFAVFQNSVVTLDALVTPLDPKSLSHCTSRKWLSN
jgi:hypothetical protein